MDSINVVEEVFFESVEELHLEISPFGKFDFLLQDYIFRGESSDKYKLIPSALRAENKNKIYSLCNISKPIEEQSEWEYWQQTAEFYSLKKFFNMADDRGILLPDISYLRDDILSDVPLLFEEKFEDKWIPKELIELSALAQHYGLPTRFIDWSLSHYIALYFAVSGAIKRSNIEYDHMVLWALDYRHIEYLKKSTVSLPIRLVKPSYNRNPNLLAQRGVLSCWQYENELSNILPSGLPINRTSLDILIKNYVTENCIPKGRNAFMYKFHIPISERFTLYKFLSNLNFTADSLFPGLSGVLRRMQEDTFMGYNQDK
jgi:hypothetical protein